MPQFRTTWTESLHLSFRLLPEASTNLRPFLESDGLSEAEVLSKLPYDAARARSGGSGSPDPRRFREGKQVYQTAGLLYQDEAGIVRVTELGRATLRWLDLLHDGNVPVLGRHAAFALAAAQLRNPTGDGEDYDAVMEVFPFSFIWRAMLHLECRINSDEMNRAIMKVRNEEELEAAIDSIHRYRQSGDLEQMGHEVVTGTAKNDRIIPWMSFASFGWTLIADKRESTTGHYEIRSRTLPVVAEAARVRHPHREFVSVAAYVEHLSSCAALQEDLR